MRNIQFLLLLIAVVSFTSCLEDNLIDTPTGGVFMPSSGYGGSSAATLSHFNKSTGEIHQFIPSPYALVGITTHTMQVFNGKAYLPVIGSNGGIGDLLVYSINDLNVIGTLNVNNVSSVCILNESLGYVSHVELIPDSTLVTGGYTRSFLSSFNPESLMITGTIAEGVEFYEMLPIGNNFIVATAGSYLYKINSVINQIVDSVFVPGLPTKIVQDINGKVWTITNQLSPQPIRLVKIDVATMEIESMFTLTEVNGPTGNPWDFSTRSSLSIDGSGQMLYWIYDLKVYRMPISSTASPSSPFVAGVFASVGIDPMEHIVYLSKSSEFINGETLGCYVHRYSINGTQIDSMQTGLGIVSFCFIGL